MPDQAPDRRRRRRRTWTVLVLACCALLVAVATWTDVAARAKARQADAALIAARSRLGTLRTDLARTTYVHAVVSNHRDSLGQQISAILGQLGSIDSQLASTNVSSYLRGVNLATMQTCLGGVQKAKASLDANDNADAAKALSDVAGPCSTLDGGTDAGLVYPFNFPDPDVLPVVGSYVAYASNSVAGNIEIIDSTDLVNWKVVGNALPRLPTWASANDTWAPSVALIGGTYVMYYAVQIAGSGIDCISAATAAQPMGPFVDNSTGPLACQPSLGGSIDPAAFFDTHGALYLVWKSDGGGNVALWSQPLAPNGTSFVTGTTATSLLAPDQAWEGGNIEAPDMVTAAGRYWLFFSGNDWNSASYAVGVASCAGPLGPCRDASAGPILKSEAALAGPGGESVFADHGGAFHIAFHAWMPGAVGFPQSRDLYIRRLDLSGAVPVVEAAG